MNRARAALGAARRIDEALSRRQERRPAQVEAVAPLGAHRRSLATVRRDAIDRPAEIGGEEDRAVGPPRSAHRVPRRADHARLAAGDADDEQRALLEVGDEAAVGRPEGIVRALRVGKARRLDRVHRLDPQLAGGRERDESSVGREREALEVVLAPADRRGSGSARRAPPAAVRATRASTTSRRRARRRARAARPRPSA